ncbi:MAG: T9SS type A sorting domain-containing protein [Bacteroidia bacterium]|nr:T9SS type A sorting domain-containing protein [Bacteroidia bacterium]
MDTRRVILTLLALTVSMTIYSQLNPIKNLYFNAWYVMPNNYFELNWSPPDTSLTDTLIGYNVYRGNLLYRFQTDTTMHHFDIQDTNTPASFLGGDGMIEPPFYIHITAVYNSTHIESKYIDSALCYGLAINVKKVPKNNLKLEITPNPVRNNLIITIELEETPNGEQFVILNEQGIVIQRTQLLSKISKIKISNLSLKCGIYFCCLIDKDQIITKKFIKQE